MYGTTGNTPPGITLLPFNFKTSPGAARCYILCVCVRDGIFCRPGDNMQVSRREWHNEGVWYWMGLIILTLLPTHLQSQAVGVTTREVYKPPEPQV